jgi:hypothetical protein
LKFKVKHSEDVGRTESIIDHFENSPDLTPDVLRDRVFALFSHNPFDPVAIFDTANFGWDFNVFEIAQAIIDNEGKLGEISSFSANKDIIEEMANFATTMCHSKFNADHSEWVIRARMRIRSFPCFQGLKEERLDNIVRVAIDDLEYDPRLQEVMDTLEQEIRKQTSDSFSLKKFLESYYITMSPTCQGFKLLTALARTIPLEERVWIKGEAVARRELDAIAKAQGLTVDQARQAWAMVHAMSMELMMTLDFPGVDRSDGTITVLRTETRVVPFMHGVKCGNSADDNGKKMRHTALVCSTCDSCVVVFGTEITLYEKVPIYLVYGGFFVAPCSAIRTIMFDPYGLPLTYVGTVKEVFSEAESTSVPRDGENGRIDKLLQRFGLTPMYDKSGEIFYKAT